MPSAVNADTVLAFLHRFDELANHEDFSLIAEMVHEQAVFRFNDGDFIGRAAVEAAFEKTWRGDPSVKKARFFLSDIVLLSIDQASASVTYSYNWVGSQGGREFTVRGRGTRVLVLEGGRLQIKHEHLSRFPPAA